VAPTPPKATPQPSAKPLVGKQKSFSSSSITPRPASAQGSNRLPTKSKGQVFDNVDSAMANKILNDVVVNGPPVTWDDIGKFIA
jgi:hypothetical protein